MMQYAYKTALSSLRNRKTKNQTMSHALPIPMHVSLSIRMAGYPFGTVGTVGDNPLEAMLRTLCMAGDMHDAAVSRMDGDADALARAGDVAEALFLLNRDADAMAGALALGCRGAGEARYELQRLGTLSGFAITITVDAKRAEIETKG